MRDIGHNFFENIENSSLLLINLWPGSPMHYTTQLTNRLAKRNKVILLLSKNCDPKYIDRNVLIKIIDVEIPLKYKELRDFLGLLNFFYYLNLRQIIASIYYDFLITVFFHPFLISLINSKNKIFIYHDPFGHSGEKNLILNLLQRLFSYHCDYVVVHDAHLIPIDLPKHEKIKYRIAEHGTFDFLKSVGDKNIKPEKEILFIGRFVKYKGVEYLIRAFEEIQNKFPDWRLVIKGSGYPYFKKELRRINPSQLLFENKFLSDEELVNSVRRASIIALPYVDCSHSGVWELAKTFGKKVIGGNILNFNQFRDELMHVLETINNRKIV